MIEVAMNNLDIMAFMVSILALLIAMSARGRKPGVSIRRKEPKTKRPEKRVRSNKEDK